MKLYNLYKEVILEAVDIKTVQDVINGNLAVNITYKDGSIDSNSGPRYCQILAMGKTSQNNTAVRVYQISGPNLKKDKNGKTIRWKTFLIDKMEITKTNFKFYAPPDELYNALGDKTLNIPNNGGVANMAIFSDKNLDKYRDRHAKWQSDLDTKKTNEPLVKNRSDDNEETPQDNNIDNNIGNNIGGNENKPQINYPTANDYKDSNLYSNKVADEEGVEDEELNI
jgi:hypothetical protein